ncbi:hypothetical protein [Burkholderia ubonensis]|uniref:hypothetical protein n=1 Tax=Burkholderia ubonensis TaxID=101571 RepID=UPI000ADF612C|nr:hypothetical protein [Burkholderia ubonensis]
MAKYINKEILCEAYTHLDIDIYNDKVALAKLKTALLPFFEERAKFLLGDDVEIEIIFEPGSLKTKLRVLGSAGIALAVAVNSYGSFRESVTSLARDATALTESANLEVIFRTKTQYCDRITIEKRKGVFGRVDELISNLDKQKSSVNADQLPTSTKAIQDTKTTIDRLLEWNTRVDVLFSKLDSNSTKLCISDGLAAELQEFPAEFGWHKILTGAGIRGASIRADASKLAELESLNARLNSVVKSLRKDMKARSPERK